MLTGSAGYTKGLRAGTATLADKPEWAAWMWLILFAALFMAVARTLFLTEEAHHMFVGQSGIARIVHEGRAALR